MPKSGTSFEIEALEGKQRKATIYSTFMTAEQLWNTIYTLPKSKDDKEELERKLIPSKAESIKEYVERPNTILPNSIVVNIDKTEKVTVTKLQGKLVKIQFHPFDGGSHNESKSDQKKNKYGYMVDGQHRGWGVHLSSVNETMELPVTMLIGATKEQAYKTFADINELQTKVPKLLVTYIRHEIEDTGAEEMASFEIAQALNKLEPLKGKIKFFQDEKGSWINSPSIIEWIGELIAPEGVLQSVYNTNVGNVTSILQNYFDAIKNVWPEAWGSESHVLTKAMGFNIMLHIFERVYRRCEKYEGGKFDTNAFESQLRELAQKKIEIDEEHKVPLNWQSFPYGSFSSGKGIGLIIRAIHRVFPEEESKTAKKG